MEITFDPAKDAINRERHTGISFSDASCFDWDSVRYEVDLRKGYGEERYRGFGYIGGRLHMVAFTFRDGLIVRHVDSFDLWRWLRQAQGAKGALFGWLPLVQRAARAAAATALADWRADHPV